jgi:hypothetical protein
VIAEHPRTINRSHVVGRTTYDWRHYCVFRSMSGHDSGPCRATIPEHAGRVSEAG